MYFRALVISALVAAVGFLPSMASPVAGAEQSSICTVFGGCSSKPPGMEARDIETSTPMPSRTSTPPSGQIEARETDAAIERRQTSFCTQPFGYCETKPPGMEARDPEATSVPPRSSEPPTARIEARETDAAMERRESPACTQVAGCYTTPGQVEARATEAAIERRESPICTENNGICYTASHDMAARDNPAPTWPPQARAVDADTTTLNTVFV